MRKILFLSIALIIVLIQSLFAQTNSDMLERVLSSVVTVAVYKSEETKQILGFRGTSDDAYTSTLDLSNTTGSGSGFIIEKNNKKYIITNAHVVEDASEEAGSLYVFTINRSKYEAKIIGGDSFYDIAVLEFVDKPGDEISILNIRTTEPRLGEQVFAIGNPLGEYPYTVSDGIISAKNRIRGGATGKFGFLQSTATVIWGNSGGPLVDINGELVGINSQIAFAQNNNTSIWQPQINFALEAILSNRLIDDIINNNGRVKRAYMGLEMSQRYELVYDLSTFTQTWQLKDEQPVITGVLRASPAFTNLSDKVGYIVQNINGMEIRNLEDALGAFEKIKPGENAVLIIKKDEDVQTVNFKTQELNPQRNEQLARFVLEKENRITLSFKDNQVTLQVKSENIEAKNKASYNPTETYQVLTVGVSENNFNTLWRLNNLSDLGAALRLTGLYGLYDIFVVNKNNPKAPTEKYRVNLSDDEYIRKLTLWY